MARKNFVVPPTFGELTSRQNPPPLRQQSRYTETPWRPGQIPADPFMAVSRRHNSPPVPYGHGAMGVECPTDIGAEYPMRMDLEKGKGETPWDEGKAQISNNRSFIKSKR